MSANKNCLLFYNVTCGDSCWSISQRFNIPISNLYYWNGSPGVKGSLICNAIYEGQTLCVNCPTCTTPPQLASNCNRKYVVLNDDSCFSIAVKYFYDSWKDIQLMNPTIQCQSNSAHVDMGKTILTPGQEICV
ncbi:hypothetical protein HK096_004539 [Nowakowskiella sp. JEL0078]|nr:hypothetical protein HK096_004539 [Nowakowskiella sp. JEL0078]